MKKTLTLLLAILIILPKNVLGMNEEIINYIEDKIEYSPGVAVGTFDTEGFETKYFGYISDDPYIPVEENTVFEWGSVSKLLIWISILQLEEKGKLSLSDSINDYLPENLKVKEKFCKPIRIINLMNHTSGFSENLFPPESTDINNIRTLEEALEYHKVQEIYEPGTVTSYSNYGATLAAYIVESVTGEKFYEYVHKNIFQPLDMNETALAPDRSDNLKVQKERAKNKSYIKMENIDEDLGDAISYIEFYPAGACTGTLKDFVKFGKSLLPKSEEIKKLFKDESTIEKLYKPTVYHYNSDVPRNSYGFWYLPYGNGIWGHGGNTAGYTANLYFDPVLGKGIAIMTNEAGETYNSYGILEKYFGTYNTEKSNTSGKDISGIYLNARMKFDKGYGRFFQIMGQIMPIKKGENSGEFKILLAGHNIRPLGENIFIGDNGNGMHYILNYKNIDGEIPVLENYTSDTFRENTYVFALKAVVFLLLIVFIVISAISFLIGLRNLIRRKSHFPIFSLSVVLVGVAIYMLLLSESVNSFSKARIYTTLVSAGTILASFSGIREILNNEGKILNILTLIVLLFNVIYWQLFMIGM